MQIRRTLAIAAISLAVGASATYASMDRGTAPVIKTQDSVGSFNDGWLTGQQDLAQTLGHRLPTSREMDTLISARATSKLPCHLEWDGGKVASYEAICGIPVPAACVKVILADQQICATLYSRPAEHQVNSDGSSIDNPAGPALVAECTSQYHGTELHSCLTQPHLG